MILGLAITRHCNLRCPHCIRDDVTTVRSLEVDLVERVLDDALELFGPVTASLTGGEPLLHPRFDALVRAFARRGVPYRMVSNGWHLGRVLPVLEDHPPERVRLSLSGATEAVHDAERGRGSFRRVLLGVGILRTRQIASELAIVVDTRTVDQLEAAIDLADSLGCPRIHFAMPQPVPASVARGTDLPPSRWGEVRDALEALARGRDRGPEVVLDYGFPFDGEERTCRTFRHESVYVDVEGRLSACCQLSEYGGVETDVVADLREVSLTEAWPAYVERLEAQRRATRPTGRSDDPIDGLPCLRCARCTGKLDWLASYPGSAWSGAVGGASRIASGRSGGTGSEPVSIVTAPDPLH